MMPLIVWVSSSIMGGILYHLGGIGKPWNTKYRDIGIPVLALITMYLHHMWHWSLIPSAILLFLALTTYNKWFAALLGYKDKTNVYWPSWAITGLFYGVSMLPYAYFTHFWVGFWIRCSILTTLTCLWSEWLKNSVLEEGGRGFLIISTLPLCGLF